MKGMDTGKYSDAIRFAVGEICEKLTSRWSDLHVGEIVIAFDAGSQGEFGEMFMVPTPSNMISWLTKYVESPVRAEAKEMISRQKAIQTNSARLLPAAKIEERKEAFRKSAPLQAWEEFKKDPAGYEIVSSGYGHALYEAIRNSGKMQNIKPETMQRAEKQAKAYMIRGRGGNIWDKLISSDGGEQSYQRRIECELVLMYFAALLKNGKELELL